MLKNKLFKEIIGMKWKNTLILPSLCVVVFGSVYFNLTKSNVPAYVEQAANRVESYLSSDYGPGDCKYSVAQGDKWKLNCLVSARSTVYEFTVLPSDQAPYSVARTFYLKADNDNARKSADQGLMQYLQIDTQ